MGSTNFYSLSWGEYGNSLATAAQLLRGHRELVDVTLAAGGRTFSAHKIVLSAASPFLLELLKSTPCQHPVIMLAGIGAEELESLLEYVYCGEISVEPAQLPSLLQAAHCLNIHGLTPPTVSDDSNEESTTSTLAGGTETLEKDAVNSCLSHPRRKRRKKSSMSASKLPRMEDNNDSENKSMDGQDQENKTDPDIKVDDVIPNAQGDDTGDGNFKARSMSDQPATCPLCGAIIRQSRNLRRHLELLHFGTGKSGRNSLNVRSKKLESNDDLQRAAQLLLGNRESTNEVPNLSLLSTSRADHPHMKPMESSDMPSVPPASMVSSSPTISSIANITLPGNVMVPSSLMSSSEQSCIPGTMQTSSCVGAMASPSSSIYSPDATANMLSCLLPPLASLSSLSSPHDVFRHGEMLRAGVAYYDMPRQQSRHFHRTDVT